MEIDANSRPVVRISIVSDIICPWCWIGKRKLEEAIADLESKYTFCVRWEPYLLKPDCPPDGITKPVKNLENLKDPRIGHLVAAGEAVGIKLSNKCPVYPNTVLAHVLLNYSASQDGGNKQNEVTELLFWSYFTDGKSLVKDDLLEVARKVYFDIPDVLAYLDNPINATFIKKKAQSWSAQGIHGVPYFIINGKPAFSGAQDKNVFKKIIEKLAY